ncbi:MAG: hypothetical protein H7833_03250 [Magnetococcus sp. DMHC-1]
MGKNFLTDEESAAIMERARIHWSSPQEIDVPDPLDMGDTSYANFGYSDQRMGGRGGPSYKLPMVMDVTLADLKRNLEGFELDAAKI